MGNKWKNANQMELFDGQAVEKYQLAFTGNFSSDEIDVEALALDDHVCLLVIASVGSVQMKKNNEDEVIRHNKLEVLRAVELDAKVADYALAKQAASAGAPMLPNFSDPDDDDPDQDPVTQDDEDPDEYEVEVIEDPSDLDEPYEVLADVRS
jgi:hypothetical protein